MFAYTGEHEPEPLCVTFTGSDRIVHEVEVWASTVYEAVGEAMREFGQVGSQGTCPA